VSFRLPLYHVSWRRTVQGIVTPFPYHNSNRRPQTLSDPDDRHLPNCSPKDRCVSGMQPPAHRPFQEPKTNHTREHDACKDNPFP
jgi:hypothetical protein